MDRWNQNVVENIKNYLTGNHYSENVSTDEKRKFRKQAKDFAPFIYREICTTSAKEVAKLGWSSLPKKKKIEFFRYRIN